MAATKYSGWDLRGFPLVDLPIGTQDGNQVLVAKEGDLQLWKSEDTGKFGVQRIKDNDFVPIVQTRAEEAIAQEVFSTMAYSAMAHKVVQWLIKERT